MGGLCFGSEVKDPCLGFLFPGRAVFISSDLHFLILYTVTTFSRDRAASLPLYEVGIFELVKDEICLSCSIFQLTRFNKQRFSVISVKIFLAKIQIFY